MLMLRTFRAVVWTALIGLVLALGTAPVEAQTTSASVPGSIKDG
jgi:hypothetical protein